MTRVQRKAARLAKDLDAALDRYGRDRDLNDPMLPLFDVVSMIAALRDECDTFAGRETP